GDMGIENARVLGELRLLRFAQGLLFIRLAESRLPRLEIFGLLGAEGGSDLAQRADLDTRADRVPCAPLQVELAAAELEQRIDCRVFVDPLPNLGALRLGDAVEADLRRHQR